MTNEKTTPQAQPVGMYEIKFAVDHGAQEWAGMPEGAAYAPSEKMPGFTDAVIILPAYTAEDALTDFQVRMHRRGWHSLNIVVKSITPAQENRPDPRIE